MAKIAINCIFYQPRGGGISEYIYNLITNIERIDNHNEYILYVLKDMVGYAKEKLATRFEIKQIPYSSSYVDVIKRSLFSQRFWTREEEEENFDLFHSPFFHSPRFKRAKVLITVHDMRFYRFPYTYTLPRYVYLKYAVKRSCILADHIITISRFTKEELMKAYGISSEKITVVHEAINKDRFSAKSVESYSLPSEYQYLVHSKYILSVGHLEPRKNYERLIDAFAKLKNDSDKKDLRLLIVGKKGHHYSKILKKIRNTADVVYLNFVDHNMLQWLYNNASLFAFPSYYEGFGFPPLEAGCYGVVSAVSNVSSMPEVCGESVFYFNPYDVDDMATVLKEALSNSVLRKEKELLMANQIDSFSWRENARQTLTLYQKLVGLNGDNHE